MMPSILPGKLPIVASERSGIQKLFGRRYRMPEHVQFGLVEVFGPTVNAVKVIEHSRYARLHLGAAATTRPGAILLAISGDEFISNSQLLLHEYFHVLNQWNTGRLTRWRYLIESALRGYWNNRFEVEARQFAASASEQFEYAVNNVRGPLNIGPANGVD